MRSHQLGNVQMLVKVDRNSGGGHGLLLHAGQRHRPMDRNTGHQNQQTKAASAKVKQGQVSRVE